MTGTVTIQLRTPAEIPALWPVVAPLLAPAMERTNGRQTEWSVLSALQKGEKQLWTSAEGDTVTGALTTSIAGYADTRWLHIGLCGGSGILECIGVGLPLLREYAAAEGCSGVLVTGRKGWSRVLNVEPSAYQYEILVDAGVGDRTQSEGPDERRQAR